MHPDVVSSASAVAPSNDTEQKPAKSETRSEVEETNTSKTAKSQQEKPAIKEKLPAPSVCVNTNRYLSWKGDEFDSLELQCMYQFQVLYTWKMTNESLFTN